MLRGKGMETDLGMEERGDRMSGGEEARMTLIEPIYIINNTFTARDVVGRRRRQRPDQAVVGSKRGLESRGGA